MTARIVKRGGYWLCGACAAVFVTYRSAERHMDDVHRGGRIIQHPEGEG